MKKLNFFLLCSILATQQTFAQISKYQYGIEIGSTINSLTENFMVIGNDLNTGYSTGAYFQYNSAKLFSYKAQIAYVQKGGESFSNTIPKIKTKLDYLELPITTKFSYGNKFKLFAALGPYYGILLSQKNNVIFNDESNGKETEQIDDFKNSDFGISSSFGVEFRLNNKINLSLEKKNSRGLINIAQDQNQDIKTFTISMLLGINIKL